MTSADKKKRFTAEDAPKEEKSSQKVQLYKLIKPNYLIQNNNSVSKIRFFMPHFIPNLASDGLLNFL